MAHRLHGTPLRGNRKRKVCGAVDGVAGGIAEDETGCGGTTQVFTGNASCDTHTLLRTIRLHVGRRASGFVLVA